QQAWADHLGVKVVEEVDLGGGVTLEFMLIPPGEFLMGAPIGETGSQNNEKPQHRVRITRPFHLGRYAVTQDQYKEIVGKNPSWFSAGKVGKVKDLDTSRFPVESVSWEEATTFLDKLNDRHRGQLPAPLQQGGCRFQLPTEAQWAITNARLPPRIHSFGSEESSPTTNSFNGSGGKRLIAHPFLACNETNRTATKCTAV